MSPPDPTPPEPPTSPDAAADLPVELDPDAAIDADPVVQPKRNNRKKLLLSILVLLIAIYLLQVGPLSHLGDRLTELKLFVRSFGLFAPAVYALIVIVLTPLGVPRWGFGILAGALFGVLQGLPLALFSTLAGAWIMFVTSRYFGRDWGFGDRKLARSRFGRLLLHPDFGTIFVMRQMPVYGMLTNVVLGLSKCSHRDFLIGTMLGFLPQAVMAVLLGSGLGKDNWQMAALQTGGAICALLVSIGITWKTLRSQRARGAAAAQPPAASTSENEPQG